MSDQSWATKQARSYLHMQSICQMSLEEAKKRLELFEKNFPVMYKFWSQQLHLFHDTIEIRIRTDGEGVKLAELQPL